MPVLFRLAFILLVSVYLSPSYAKEPLKIFNWEGYLSQELINKWEQLNNQKIEQVFYDNEEERDRILTTPAAKQYDLIILSSFSAKAFSDSGYFIKPDQHKLPNINHIEPKWRSRCGEDSVPYFWGSTGLLYRKDKFVTPPASWKDLLHPKPSIQGHIGMIDDYSDMLAPALLVLGYSINTESPEELKGAFNLLKQQSQHVATYEYAASHLQKQNRTPLYLALGYSGDQHLLNKIEGKPVWDYNVPKEGTAVWTDCIAINRNTQNLKAALSFIDFINMPKMAALNAEEQGMASTNAAAIEYLSESNLQDTSLYLPADILEKSEFYNEISPQAIVLRQKITHNIIKSHVSE